MRGLPRGAPLSRIKSGILFMGRPGAGRRTWTWSLILQRGHSMRTRLAVAGIPIRTCHREAGAGSPQRLHEGVELGNRDCWLSGAALGSRHNAHRHLGVLSQISGRPANGEPCCE